MVEAFGKFENDLMLCFGGRYDNPKFWGLKVIKIPVSNPNFVS